MVTGPERENFGVNDLSAAGSRLRIDKWLWFARIVKTRTLAAKLVGEGRIRVNSVRIETPAKAVGPGDVLTIGLERDVRVLRIIANAERRGPYSEARLLYEDVGQAQSP
jgi:ribosome-associated heat shock protein Hsp15